MKAVARGNGEHHRDRRERPSGRLPSKGDRPGDGCPDHHRNQRKVNFYE